jgi:hypothetical protein
MSIGEQFHKLKENWLIILLVLIVLILPSISNIFSSVSSSNFISTDRMSYGASSGAGIQNSGGNYNTPNAMPISINNNFAPDEKNRQITKTVSMSTEIKRGDFSLEQEKVMAIVDSSGSFLLNQNVNNYGSDINNYHSGYYTIKVEAPKMNSVVTQLKTIGEVKSYVEQKDDITGQYTNAQIELDAEKARLNIYIQMMNETTIFSDKLTLSDKIFDEQRTVQYLEDRIANLNTTVDYSTIYYTITEKQSDYANVVFVKFSELIQNLVASLNTLVTLIFGIIPWVIATIIIVLIVKSTRHNKK